MASGFSSKTRSSKLPQSPNSPRTRNRKNKANRQTLFRHMNTNNGERYANSLHRYSVKDLEKMTNKQINGLHEINEEIKEKLKLWKREKNTVPGVLKYLGISAPHAKILADAKITYKQLRSISRAELIGLGFKVGPAILIKKWQKTADDISSFVHVPSFFPKHFASGTFDLNDPLPPVLQRQNTISYQLYQELTDKGDDTRKYEMDRALEPLSSIVIDGHKLELEKGDHLFVIGHDNDIYFNWLNTAGRRHFHVSLHNSRASRFSNRTSVERQEIGSLHVKQDIGGVKSRRILINYNLETHQYEVSIDKDPKTKEPIDEFTRKIVAIFKEYYYSRNNSK
jgi:hypothetical protein